MRGKKPPKQAGDNQPAPRAPTTGTPEPQPLNNRFRNLFARTNRGLLLDVFVFVLNVFLMRFLTRQVINLFSQVSVDAPPGQLLLGITCAAMWVLPAAGAVLKRWNFHQRRNAPTLDTVESNLGGCLFNPILYFSLNLVITAAVVASLGTFVFGEERMDAGPVFITLIFIGLALTILQTILIYRYFSPPKKPPRWDFLRTPQAETLGDICLFLNMILFQVGWNLLTFAKLPHPSGPAEFFGRLFVLCFMALLVYFPPRMFYLAEDINRRSTWLMMLLANSPVILRVLIGSSSKNW
jgi:hypothetical protein